MAHLESIDQSELVKLVQEEAMKLPDWNIAISGLAGRYPKCDSVNEFEQNLREGVDMVNNEDNARFTCRLWGLPPRAGRLKDLSRFDSEFFGYSNLESNYIDYQLRILYEVVYESILDAGVNPATLRGSNTGVFFGFHCNEFENVMADDPAFKTNGYYGQFAVKVAQYFDLHGITVTFDAACASGFVGLHNAIEALKMETCDRAIVCSANIPIHPTGSFIFLQMQMLSPTGYSRFLDSRADGYVKSESCVSILLERKELARRNYATILASMTSVDGYKKEGITFPSSKSQERLIRSTKNLVGMSTNHVEYIEAHGTGTPAGDPQEAIAITNVYFAMSKSHNDSKETDADADDQQDHTQQQHQDQRIIGPLLVGSVKTNMGHSEAASGLCALTKVALMLENELIYGGLHYEKPNANIASLTDGRLKFVQKTKQLTGKIIPLSCYGFGGSNVHIIVRANEAPKVVRKFGNMLASKEPARLVVMFGRSDKTLNSFFDSLINSDESYQNRNTLSDDFLYLIGSLNAGKIDRLMDHRGFLIVDRNNADAGNGREIYRSVGRCVLPTDRSKKHFQESKQKACHILLPGLGCQWQNMASGLQNMEQFWSTIQRLAKILEPFEAEIDLLDVMTGRTDLTNCNMVHKFCAIVAYQIALINMVKDKLRCNSLASIIGHSLGEVSAAYASGLFDEREAMVVALRMGRVLDENRHLISGKMIAIPMGEPEALKLIRGYETVRISCINGPESVTISGSHNEIDRILNSLKTDGWFFKVVDEHFALHNETIMGPKIMQKLEESLLKVLHPFSEFDRTKTTWISSSTEGEANRMANASYFSASMCRKVDFLTCLNKLDGDSIALELGPSGLFEAQVKLMKSKRFHYIKMMREATEESQQVVTILKSIGQLYMAGTSVDLTSFYNHNRKCARRQTPSLSSLFKWNHEQEFFVPRYPMQFSKSSAKSELPVDILQERDKYLAGHCIEGRCLFPATGYLFIIWRIFSFTKRKIYDSCFQDVENELMPVEFINVRLHRAVILGNKSVQFYLHYEESTGKFEVKEGGSVVCEGWARTPVEKPNGLLYDGIRDYVKSRNPKPELTGDDIYKQFRVSGYDYGETFQNIQLASGDGTYCKVKFNGHFVSLTDNILQSIFLAVTQYAPSGGLFLPTRFEYVRFQPEIILAKIREAKMKFDHVDGSLNTLSKREIMTKIMERESENFNGSQDKQDPTNEAEKAACEEQKQECFFESYCDPVTGIIISDGIEMRGIKACPAPRRVDNNEVLLESYQFVPDHEEPVEDENLTKFNSINAEYTRVCDSMSANLLRLLCNKNTRSLKEIEPIMRENDLVSDADIELYKRRNLVSFAGAMNGDEKSENIETLQPKAIAQNDSTSDEHSYDIDKNGNKVLLSVLDQILSDNWETLYANQMRIRDTVKKNQSRLSNDLIQGSYVTERIMRPLIETVIENSCQKKMKLKIFELNLDDGLVQGPLTHLLKSVEPSLAIDYTLAHPDIERLKANKLLPTSSSHLKTQTLKDVQSVFEDRGLRDMDLIIYKDVSCYSLPKQVIEKNGLTPVMVTLSDAVKPGGFLIVIMRQKLTLAERVLLALSDPQLIGLSRKDIDQLERGSCSSAIAKVNGINSILKSRCELMQQEAKHNHLLCISRKCDQNGCLVMLFKADEQRTETGKLNKLNIEPTDQKITPTGRLIVRVSHENKAEIENWIHRLKENFKTETKQQENEQQQQQQTSPEIAKKQVWLCAIATKDRQINGIVGMMQALKKELGSSYLRCYYDQYTFKDSQDPITESQIENCQHFQLALERNLIWNCVDEFGRFGSYRHFTINDYLSYSDCLCSKQSIEQTTASKQSSKMDHQLVPAYVNNSARGDLASFTWYEAPFKYLDASERENLVTVAYSALNFRDIMLATGRLPLDAIPIRLAMCDCLLGLEFSGYDHENRRVMGMVFGRGIASQVICPKLSSIKLEIPDNINMKEAATIPVVYATAIMALIYRGKMKPGESILIHAGSGGVGQAAIRLALHFGLEVFTTVGTEEKRKFLLEEFGTGSGSINVLRDDHIFSSRDCNFEQLILEATSGRGVDLVLNSLADDKLQASVRSLADGGRFLEIGKYDMSTDARLELHALNHNKTFHGILLDKLFDTDDIGVSFRCQLECVLETLKDGLAQGYVKPIKYTLFKRDQIEEAFRYMATGKHVGKILVEINPDVELSSASKRLPPLKCVPKFQLSPEKSYIITGGLGGFGLELTKWLVNQGAKHILITSRSGLKTGYQRVTLARLENMDTKFAIITHDTTTRDGVRKLLDSAIEMAPSKQIGAIFHLAMVLKDTLLENMTSDDFLQVCIPKVHTCEHMDSILNNELKDMKLDYFVVFSSVTSGKGNAGQANYAYANSCIERICERRRARGQHGLAIQWGAIGDVGVAFENLGGNNVVVGGTIPQRMPSCQATLSKLLCSPFSVCLSVLPVNRGDGAAGSKTDLVGAIFHVLGIKDPSKVSDASSLGELGLDSLMAVEIRQYIEREYDMTLNMQEIRALTIGKIREIGENGPSKRAKISSGADNESGSDNNQLEGPKIVDNYGKLTSNQATMPAILTSGSFKEMFDKNVIGSFKPALRLAKKKYLLLNDCNPLGPTTTTTAAATTTKSNGHSSNGLTKSNGIVSKQATNGVDTNDGSIGGSYEACRASTRRLRPIFFVPPIHGSFKQLEPICKLISRPCVGLNWTRQLGRAASIQEVVECYLECLENFNWLCYDDDDNNDAKANGNGNRNRKANDGNVSETRKHNIVDLVGYSYGATVAFELMVAIERKKAKLNGSSRLAPGRLVLLDGSPRQIELGSQLLSSLNARQRRLSEKVDELLMFYILSHAKAIQNVNFLDLQQELSRIDLESKFKFASGRLCEILQLNKNKQQTPPTTNGNRETDCCGGVDSNDSDSNDCGKPIRDTQTEVEHAMEAFCRRYDHLDKYKVGSKLASDCTLIRAQKIYLKAGDQKYNDDLDLSSVVSGNVNLFIMAGDHESFLSANKQEVAKIISN